MPLIQGLMPGRGPTLENNVSYQLKLATRTYPTCEKFEGKLERVMTFAAFRFFSQLFPRLKTISFDNCFVVGKKW